MKNTLKFAFIIILLSSFHITKAQVPTLGLVGDYSFNGNANDNSGLGNNGIVWGATPAVGRNGQPNTAYHFNGSTNYIEIADAPSLKLDTAMTLFAVFLAEDYYHGQCQGSHLINKWLGNNGYGLLFTDNNYDQNCTKEDTTHELLTGVSGGNAWTPVQYNFGYYIRRNIWYAVAFTKSQGTEIVYINGIKYATVNGLGATSGTNNSSLKIAKNEIGAISFTGIIDEIKIYNRALSDGEIYTLSNGPCAGPPIGHIASLSTTTFCDGSNALLVADLGGYSYQWKKGNLNIPGATGRTYTADTTGNYKCFVTNACGSSTSNVIAVTKLTNIASSISSIGNTSFCAGDSITLISSVNTVAAYTYQWYRNNVSINNATNKKYTAKSPGIYKIVTKNNTTGCSRISDNEILATVSCRIANPDLKTYAIEPEIAEKSNFLIYPNPNNGSFMVEFTKNDLTDGRATVEIVNTLGNVIYTGIAEVISGTIKTEVNLTTEFAKGIYLVNIVVNGKNFNSRVMLQ